MPRLFVLIAAFMYRYLFVIVEEVGRMRAALAARAYRPQHALHAARSGAWPRRCSCAPTARGERVYQAMLARGYRGHMPQLVPLAFRRVDAAFVLAVLAPSCRCVAAGMRGMSCAIHARDLAYATPTASPACAASSCTSSTASAWPCSAPTAPARRPYAPLNGLISGSGRLEVAGLDVGPKLSPSCAPGWVSSFRTPTTSSSCRPCRRTWPSVR